MPLSTLIKMIQDIMRKDVGVDGDAQRISQMVWLLFLKIFDDKEQEWKLTLKSYKSPLQSRFQWSNWAANPEGITGEELMNNDLFPALKRLATTAGVTPQGKVVGSVFEDAYNYMKSGTLLSQVINTIQMDVDFNSSSDRHFFNDIYEKILSDLQSAGNAGEYYTPRAVTQFMVDIINPQLGETILDPACGTGGFLASTIEHLKKQLKTSKDNEVLQGSINGIENNFPKKYQTRETADLFMALIMFLLKHNTGRAAIVLPDGFLFGEVVKTTIKKELLEEFNLHTIVRLPNGVFSPYTGIKTNLLFFDKGTPTKQVWFFEHPYPDGYKSYSRSKPLTIEEFDIEKKWWNKRTQNEYAWTVTIKEIEDRNYNLDFKNPHVVDVVHGEPKTLYIGYREEIAKISLVRDNIKEELLKALPNHDLIKYFNELFNIPNNVDKLKSAILKLAMQGKLVPQYPNEQPARELLEEIEAEKKRLVKEGKIRKQESLPEIKKEEIPYELPKGWKMVRLNDVFDVRDGTHDTPKYVSEGIPLVTSKNIYTGKLDFGDIKFISEEDHAKIKGRSKVERGDILFAMIGSIGNPVIVDTDEEFSIKNVALFKYYDKQLTDNSFLHNYLVYAQEKMKNISSGAVQSFVSLGFLRSYLFPLPPLAEQKRIVTKIDQLMALCDKLEQNLKNSTDKQTAILDAVLAKI